MKCELCEQKHSGEYGSGRFCSVKCARAFSTKSDKDAKKVLRCKCCGETVVVGKRAPNVMCDICKKQRFVVWEKKHFPLRHKCRICGEEILKKFKQLCEQCRIELHDKYRFSCNFDFDITAYSDKFDLSLVKQFGWYSPSNKGNNLGGVVKDHLFTVRDGFKYGVSPEVMKHPANCRLIVQLDNQRKRDKSSISLNELYKRIQEF